MSLIMGCQELPSLEERSESRAVPPEATAETWLGRAILPYLRQADSGLSGIRPLPEPREAFASRMLLAQTAERTLDIQYYIWHPDLTGTLLLEALHTAADRGVRVRLLLDDNGISGMDETLAALDSHPNVEVRLFNPFRYRRAKWLGYVTDFSRANRRMHNKSFIADNQAAIIGGRNIGDEYFGATDGVLFADLDVMAVGAVVPDVSRDFDLYWASESAYPVAGLLDPAGTGKLVELSQRAEKIEREPRATSYMAALRETDLIHSLAQGELELRWSRVRMLSDDPAKGLGKADDADLLTSHLQDIIGDSSEAFSLVSPYFVPTEAGTRAFRELAKRGVASQVLTNSLAATDVLAVHAGYVRQRRALLEAGVDLYELKMTTSTAGGNAGPLGSSGSSLHAKTFTIDDRRVFIGSFNFDPRSARLNTEQGFIIDDPDLATRIREAFDQRVPQMAYHVELSPDGRLVWETREGDSTRRLTQEPNSHWWQRGLVWFVSKLPVEWLL
ncbi:phospholipase D family protein [Salinicola peritrichatus]|uniref:phospholipase D family protein n=1 Tax=Salinicola peritrichatus TaxID=1267424 RepID=UPI001EF75A6F|nr:phospholipase D family protein [Salinicola peritrichatus]